MAELTKRTVTELVGDFYEGHASGDREKMNRILTELDALLMTGEAAHIEFIEYFNEIFSGRTAFNTLLNVKDYPQESVIRELLQNAFDCEYEEEDIKIAVNFKDNHTISISYNEVGFILEQFMFYLSFGRNTGGSELREGRFGVGAKSVFMNVEWLTMRSNNFSFCIANNDGMLKITDINLRRPIFKGTEMVIKVDPEQHRRIKENFMSITRMKGDYINLVELCFAFNRKKVLRPRVSPDLINDKRTFNIVVMNNGKLIDFYKIYNHHNKAVDVNVIRFTQGGKSVADFIRYEDDGFVYLIPFAVAASKRTDLVRLLSEGYNYFSTYELTGLLQNEDSSFVNQKLSAFFISVPNRNITSFRTGIRPEKESEVATHVELSVMKIIEDYKRFFVLEIQPNQDASGLYHLRPESYAFEFIKNFILTGNLDEEIKREFLRGVSLRYSREEPPLQYVDLQKTAFFSSVKGVPKEQHHDGSAYAELIEEKLRNMNEKLADLDGRILYAGYNWEGEQEGVSETVYVYEFHRDGGIMAMSSDNNPAGTDYGLFDGFMSLTVRIVEKALGGDRLISETSLLSLLTALDDVYGDKYRVSLKDGVFYVLFAEDEIPVKTKGMKIESISDCIACLAARKKLFKTYQDYTDMIALVLNVFKAKQSVADFLRAVKEQGGSVVLQRGQSGEYCFIVYETEFAIPADMPNSVLLEIIGDINILIKAGVLIGKKFDFAYGNSRYSFEADKIAGILATDKIPEQQTAEIVANIKVCDMQVDKIALLGANDKVIDIINYRGEIAKRGEVKKFIVMRADNTKEEVADLIEHIVTGEVKNILRRRYMGAKTAKIVIPDQLAFYLKPLPTISKDEFAHLRGVAKEIAVAEKSGKIPVAAKSLYAKDVNFKLFGYGGNCSFCRFSTDGLNGFAVKDFEAKLMHDEHEKSFYFSLYLCADDAILCDSWVIDDVTIHGKSPFMWLEEIAALDAIPPEYLTCTITYREQITHDISGREDDPGVVMTPQKVNSNIILTPLMAANWVNINSQ
ncbi:MAG: hypothetical protein FWH20_06565 [Oscillospiraceae bacterium]|nr:hypothetical protein [Oscillospiraceae bacterium]